MCILPTLQVASSSKHFLRNQRYKQYTSNAVLIIQFSACISSKYNHLNNTEFQRTKKKSIMFSGVILYGLTPLAHSRETKSVSYRTSQAVQPSATHARTRTHARTHAHSQVARAHTHLGLVVTKSTSARVHAPDLLRHH